MRLYGITLQDVEFVLEHPSSEYACEGATVSEAIRFSTQVRWSRMPLVRVVHVTEGSKVVIITVMRGKEAKLS